MEQAPETIPTLDEARIAYEQGNEAVFNAWYFGRQKEADRDPTTYERFRISIDVARIQYSANAFEAANETISGVNTGITEELIELDRPGSPMESHPEKDTYARKLKQLLQDVNIFRTEIRRHLPTS